MQNSPAEILARVQTDRTVIQDFCPLAKSLEWELGQQYLAQRGSKAFISDFVPVPYAINKCPSRQPHSAQFYGGG